MNWFRRLINRFLRIFKSFVDEALPVVTQVLIGEFKDFVMNVVGTLQGTDLKDPERRVKAFQEITVEAKRRGKIVPDTIMDIMINLALNCIKNNF